MRPDIREQSYLVAQRTGVLAIGEGSIYGHSLKFVAAHGHRRTSTKKKRDFDHEILHL